MKRFLHFIACYLMVASSCVQEVTPAISLDTEQLEMLVGDERQIKVQVETNSKERLSVIWTSSDPGVASVDAGKIVANGVGTAVITVFVGELKASCTVTVHAIDVTEVRLDNTSLVLTEGGSYGLTATVLPVNATDKSVTWTSDKPSVATVSSSGVVAAQSDGDATITVTTTDGGKTASCSVTVKAKVIAVTGVSLNKTSLSLAEGETSTLTATVSPSNATDKTVTWSSSNTSIATVSSDGVVTAKAAGNATITVRTNDGGKTATCSLTVAAKTIAVTGVSLNKTTLSLTEGDTETLTATVSPSNATDKTVTWSSSNTSIATVSSDGVVTAKAAGNATITVTTVDGGKTASCSVVVSQKKAVIQFADQNLKQYLVSLYDSDRDSEISYEEAASVTSIVSLSSIKSITSFDEFQFFTGVQSVPNDWMKNCLYLKSVILPSSVKTIGTSAFEDCKSLNSINLNSTVRVDATAFKGTALSGTIQVAAFKADAFSGTSVSQILEYSTVMSDFVEFDSCLLSLPSACTIGLKSTVYSALSSYISDINGGITRSVAELRNNALAEMAYLGNECSNIESKIYMMISSSDYSQADQIRASIERLKLSCYACDAWSASSVREIEERINRYYLYFQVAYSDNMSSVRSVEAELDEALMALVARVSTCENSLNSLSKAPAPKALSKRIQLRNIASSYSVGDIVDLFNSRVSVFED